MSDKTNVTYLAPTFFLDSISSAVQVFAERVCSPDDNPVERAVKLYYAVRDEIRYDPYDLRYSREAFKASTVITKGSGYCVAKAVVLAALGRQQGIPSRLGFADVCNHLSTSRLRQVMGTNIFHYHGYTEFMLNGRWVKATPAFNLSLCSRFNVKPLPFDGENDAIFHECDETGQKHMEYLHDHGSFADLPFEKMFSAYRRHYPGLFELVGVHGLAGDFHHEAERENHRVE